MEFLNFLYLLILTSIYTIPIIWFIWIIWSIKIWELHIHNNTTFIRKILTCMFYYSISAILSIIVLIFLMRLEVDTIIPFSTPGVRWWFNVILSTMIVWCWIGYWFTKKVLWNFPKYIYWFGAFFGLCILISMFWSYFILKIEDCNWSKTARAWHSTLCTMLVWPQQSR